MSARLICITAFAAQAWMSGAVDNVTEAGTPLPTAQTNAIICQHGCWDLEDEACHAGLTEMGCAEIYGHVEWARKCNCRRDDGTLIDTETAEAKSGEVNIYFSVPTFVVMFRESLEVVIILVTIVQFLAKSRDNGAITAEMFYTFRREVYVGATLGFLACLVLGTGFLLLAAFGRSFVKGDAQLIMEGCIMIVTSVILTFLALSFYKMIFKMDAHERKFREMAERTVQAYREAEASGKAAFKNKRAFFVLAFTTGFREGMESILFLTGVVVDLPDPSHMTSLPLPIILALVLARVVGCFFFQGTKKLNMEWFIRVMAVFLMFISAGFFSSSMHSFQELDVFGTWSPKAQRPWQNQAVWDATACCNDKTNRFFVLVRALFGWQDRATPVELFAYAFYWPVAISVGVLMIHRVLRKEAKKTASREEAAALEGVEEPVAVEPKVETAVETAV